MSDINTTGSTMVIAVALIPLISFFKRPTWSYRVNFTVGMIAAIIAAVGGALLDGEVEDFNQGLQLVLVALGSSQVVYNLYFRDTAINNKLTGVS